MDLQEKEFFKVEGKINGEWKKNHQKHDDIISAEYACTVFENARDVQDTRVVKIIERSGRKEKIVSSSN